MTERPANERRERILFLTGRLAERLVRDTVAGIAPDVGFDFEVFPLGISVAALLHASLVQRRLNVADAPDPRDFDRVIIPGWCQGDLTPLTEHYGVPFELGPKDVAQLPEYFGREKSGPPDLSQFDIEIIAEINHAPRMADGEILALSERYRRDGADLIDVGCIPGSTWSRVADVVAMLKNEGFRVSIDSFDRAEVEPAVAAGAELVLSCNSTNVEWAADLDAELVVIPDDPHDLDSLDVTVAKLRQRGRYRLDPIVEPIGFGFAASLARYHETRRRHPQAAMMMGVGNLTEMTEVDSAGVNVLLAAICQELCIFSVLTTEVINWARSSVKEFDLARRLVRHAVENQTVPKHVDDALVSLRDPKGPSLTNETARELAASVKDPNYRILVEAGEIHVINRDGHWHGRDAYELFDAFSVDANLTPSHAFYLGYELSKAVTALTLDKRYTQDEALRWGHLTVPEPSAMERRNRGDLK